MRRYLLVFGVMFALSASHVFAQETEGEETEKEPIWKGSLGLSWVATSGNTDTSTFGLDFGLDRKPEPWGLSFVLRGNRAEDSGVTTAENYLVSGRAVQRAFPPLLTSPPSVATLVFILVSRLINELNYSLSPAWGRVRARG